jgi:hypothetical protein
MFRFTPRSDDDLVNILPEGEHKFTVKKCAPHTSKNTGNESVRLTLEFFKKTGQPVYVDVYLSPSFEIMIKDYCYSVGIGEDYESGCFDVNKQENKSGVAKLVVEEKIGYDKRNKVLKFIRRVAGVEGFDDEVPF